MIVTCVARQARAAVVPFSCAWPLLPLLPLLLCAAQLELVAARSGGEPAAAACPPEITTPTWSHSGPSGLSIKVPNVATKDRMPHSLHSSPLPARTETRSPLPLGRDRLKPTNEFDCHRISGGRHHWLLQRVRGRQCLARVFAPAASRRGRGLPPAPRGRPACAGPRHATRMGRARPRAPSPRGRGGRGGHAPNHVLFGKRAFTNHYYTPGPLPPPIRPPPRFLGGLRWARVVASGGDLHPQASRAPSLASWHVNGDCTCSHAPRVLMLRYYTYNVYNGGGGKLHRRLGMC